MNVLLHAAGALVAIGGFIVGGCSSPDRSCPGEMPSTGAACNVANQSSVPGSVPECGYVTDTNECGAANCYCEHAAWVCGPTCAIVDASGIDQSTVEASIRDASLVEGGADVDGSAAEASGSDASVVEASVGDGLAIEASSE